MQVLLFQLIGPPVHLPIPVNGKHLLHLIFIIARQELLQFLLMCRRCCFQLGQPRIWMSMSRDGLLPKKFQKIHPKYLTPSFATIVTGCLVAIPALFLEDNLVTDLTSIGTLFAFALVSAGVLVLPRIRKEPGKFSLPYINGQWIIPIIFAIFIYVFNQRLRDAFVNLGDEGYQEVLFIIFVVIGVILSIMTFIRKYSFIPMMGVLFCLYLMVEIPAKSWIVFFGWMTLGLVIYFLYGFRHSKLRTGV